MSKEIDTQQTLFVEDSHANHSVLQEKEREPASGVGAWHQRKRVWILAYSKHNGSHRSKGNETIKSSNQSKEWVFIRDNQNVTNSQRMGWKEGSKESKEFKREATSNKSTNSIEGQSIRESCLSMDVSNTGNEGRKTWWQTQSELCGIPYGLSTSMDRNRANRIKALGNSIVPLIARELGLAIMKAEQDEIRKTF